jgi:tetratricopeptide (TPR) repeat protein
MLIGGTLKTAYPERYQLYSTVRDAREQGYLETLRKLTDWIYEHRVNAVQLEHAKLWRAFSEAYPISSEKLQDVESEIFLGYHQKRLDDLRQDLQYQSVEAQEKTEHSQAVQTEKISVLMKSQGTNPQALFDANGQQFQRPDSNPDFIERKVLWEKMTQHFAQSDQQILTLTAHGLGGMGKTELAQYYYQHPPKPYTLRAWFHAESKERVYLQYIELVEKHPKGIKFPKEMLIEEKVTLAKEWLESQKDCLLVYDNVPALTVVEELLPQRGKHHILMTSRNSVGFPRHQTLDVDVMEEGEAMALMIKITGFQESEALRQLVNNTLGCLPLAVAQAGAYLAEKQTSVEDYLRLYQRHQVALLKENTLERNPKHEPVWVTFDMNFKALEVDCPAALNTLKQASWLSSAVIPEVLLQSMINQDSNVPPELLWPDVKKYIGRYSLMKIDIVQHQFSIHPLLQDIIRLKQTPEEQLQQFRVCSETLNALEKSYYQSDLITYKALLPHAECLHAHAKAVAISIADSKTRDFLLMEPICLRVFYLRLSLNQAAVTFLTEVISTHEKHYGKDHVGIAAVLGNLGTVYLDQGNLEQAREHYERALGIQELHYGKNHVETASLLGNLGSVYRQEGKFEQAREYIERALRIREHHYGKDHVETASLLGSLGTVYREQGKFEQAREHYERALRVQEHHYGKDHVATAAVLGNLGTVYRQQGRLEQTREHYEQALRVQEHHYGKDHVATAAMLGSLGNIYFQEGKLEQAREHYEQALRIKERHYGKDHVEMAAELGNLGTVYRDQGKLEQGREHYERALRIQERRYGKDHVETAAVLGNLGTVYRKQGKFEQAREYNERALRVQECHYGKNHVETATVLGSLGDLYLQQGRFEEARGYMERALGIKERHYGKDHVETATVLGNLGIVYRKQGKFEQAREYTERALRIKEGHYGKNHPEVANTWFNLALNNIQSNQPTIVQSQLQRAQSIYHQHFPEGHPILTQIEQYLQKHESQTRAEEGDSGLLPRALNNGINSQRTYCPYFSKAALISFSILAAGVAFETGRRYYFKP